MIDARGQSCPIPVVMVQKEVKRSDPAVLEVLVDSQVCVENITRFAHLKGYKVVSRPIEGDYALTLTKG